MKISLFFLILFIFSCADMGLNEGLIEKTDLMESFGISNKGVIEKLPSDALVPSQYQVPHRSFFKNQNLMQDLNEPGVKEEEFIYFPEEAFVHEEIKEEYSPFNTPIKVERIEDLEEGENTENTEETEEEEQIEEILYPVGEELQQKPIINKGFVLEELLQKQRGAKSKKVDIIFVIDHTDSLKLEYNTLSKNIYNLLDNYRDLEWNLGFLTAIYQKSKQTGKKTLFWNYRKISYKEQNITEKLFSIFKSLKQDNRVACLNYSCPFYPRLLDILHSFLNKDLQGAEYIRPQADYLSLIFVTDRDLEEKKSHPVFEVLKAYNYSFSSISVPAPQYDKEDSIHTCYEDRLLVNNIADFSNYLNDLVVKNNGFIGTICGKEQKSTSDPYYIQSLLSKKNTLITAFSLLKEPVVKTMSVTIFPSQNKQIFWMTQKKKLYFNKPPSAGSVIEVLYESK